MKSFKSKQTLSNFKEKNFIEIYVTRIKCFRQRKKYFNFINKIFENKKVLNHQTEKKSYFITKGFDVFL